MAGYQLTIYDRMSVGCLCLDNNWLPVTGYQLIAYDRMSVDCLWPDVSCLSVTGCQLTAYDRMSVDCLWPEDSWLFMTGYQLAAGCQLASCGQNSTVSWWKACCIFSPEFSDQCCGHQTSCSCQNIFLSELELTLMMGFSVGIFKFSNPTKRKNSKPRERRWKGVGGLAQPQPI